MIKPNLVTPSPTASHEIRPSLANHWRTTDDPAARIGRVRDVPTVICFDKEHKLEVSESASEIRQAIIACGSVFVPLVCVTRMDEQKVWVNGASVRELEERSAGAEPMIA